MANNFEENHKYEIEEILGVATPQEDLHTDWCTAVIKAMMTYLDSGDTEQSIDIIKINVSTNKLGRGVRLSHEEANNTCDILLDHGYGSMDVLEREYLRRKSISEE